MSSAGASSSSRGWVGPLPSAPSRADLIALANAPDPVAPEWTRAGRALQKHGYRPTGSVFPRVTGPAAHYNAVASRIVETILADPNSRVAVRLHRRFGQVWPFVEVKATDGRGLGYSWDRTTSSFRFDGLREP